MNSNNIVVDKPLKNVLFEILKIDHERCITYTKTKALKFKNELKNIKN